MNKKLIIEKLNNDEVVAFPTDTVFGLIVKLKKQNIYKLNNIKKRKSDTPLQILFSSLEDAIKFLEEDSFIIDYLNKNYKEKTSYIVKAKKDFDSKYLLESFNQTFMFRIPTGDILELINEVGPLFATSANLHETEPMTDNDMIAKTFNINVSDIKQNSNKASYIISLVNKKVKRIR